MKIVLAGSMSFMDRMKSIQDSLVALGVETTRPQEWESSEPKQIREFNEDALLRIQDADILLVVNDTKDGQSSYIGANTLVEIGMAFALGKKIYLLNSYEDDKTGITGLIDGVVGADISRWIEAMK